jgi:hypothetical protein
MAWNEHATGGKPLTELWCEGYQRERNVEVTFRSLQEGLKILTQRSAESEPHGTWRG